MSTTAERKAGQMLKDMDIKPGNPQLSHDVIIAPKLNELGITPIQSHYSEETLCPFGKLKTEGHTQKEIGDKIGWSRDLVARYSNINDKVVTPILNIARERQTGRVTEDVTPVTFNFTEGWFRDSGLYEG